MDLLILAHLVSSYEDWKVIFDEDVEARKAFVSGKDTRGSSRCGHRDDRGRWRRYGSNGCIPGCTRVRRANGQARLRPFALLVVGAPATGVIAMRSWDDVVTTTCRVTSATELTDGSPKLSAPPENHRDAASDRCSEPVPNARRCTSRSCAAFTRNGSPSRRWVIDHLRTGARAADHPSTGTSAERSPDRSRTLRFRWRTARRAGVRHSHHQLRAHRVKPRYPCDALAPVPV